MATFKTFFGFNSAAAGAGLTTLDPARTSASIILSNGNLTATRGAGGVTYGTTLSYANVGTSVYVEAISTGNGESAIGIATGSLADDDWLGFDGNSVGLFIDTVYHNGAVIGTMPSSPTAGDIIGIGVFVDVGSTTVAFRNVTQGGAWSDDFVALGAGPLFFGFTLPVSDTNTVNFDGAFVGAVPAGFTRWNGTPAAVSYSLTADAGAVALAGQATGLRVAYKMPAVKGTFVLAGQTAGLRAIRRLIAAPGAIVLSGQTAGLRAVRKLIAAPRAIVLTGIDAALIHDTASPVLSAATGAFVLAGQPAGLRRGYILVTTKGTVALTGIAANLALRHAYRITADTGLFVLTGKDANLTRVQIIHRTLYAVSGAIVLSGKEAFLTSSAPYYPVSMASLKNRTYIRPWRHLW